MSAPDLDLARRWLQKAENDLVTARQTLLLPDGPTDTVAFHAQQAVEKALKALLTSVHVEFPKIHDLIRLLDMALPHLPGLARYRSAFGEMSNYAVQSRYPDDFVELTRDDVVRSLKIAEEAVATVKQRLAGARLA